MWVVCRPVWVTKACQLFLVPSRSSNPPLYPSKGCELGSVLRLLLFRCFLLGLTFESLEELRVRQVHSLIPPHTFLHFREYVMWLSGFFFSHTLTTSLPWFSNFLLARNLVTPLLWLRAQSQGCDDVVLWIMPW